MGEDEALGATTGKPSLWRIDIQLQEAAEPIHEDAA
jgi:hypothetical protein